MKKKREIDSRGKASVIQKIADVLKGKPDIQFAYIFGSFASENIFNDVDIGVFISADTSESFLKLELEMERELGDILHIPVDVRIINNASLSFTYNVLKSGTVIVDKDKNQRADFEGLIYKKYFDYTHLRNEYLREVVNAAV